MATFDYSTSDTWLYLKKQIEDKIEAARTALEESVDEQETQRLRGEIRAYRGVISIVETNVTPIPSTSSDYMAI